MKKILIIGFSVTADSKGYAEIAKQLLTQADPTLDVHVLGVGGVNPLPLTALFDLINIESSGYTDVVLEIATSIYGLKISSVEEEILDVLYGILHRLQAAGIRTSFVNLFRDNFDYNYHIFDMVIESICSRHDVRLLDLGRQLLVARGRVFCRSLLRDDVHTNETGSNFQGVSVASFILDFVADRKYRNFKFPAPRKIRRGIEFKNYTTHRTAFRRSGLSCEVAVLNEFESISIPLPDDVNVFGISFISGPRSGDIEIDFHDGNPHRLSCFDEYCFYKRYNFARFKTRSSLGSVKVSQLSGISAVSLKKGDKDSSPRIGELVQLHYY